MSPELINAIKERIALGRTKEVIEAEVVATGYTAEQFASAYEVATQPVGAVTNLTPDTTYYPRAATSTLISIGDLVGKMWDLMMQEWPILGKTVGVSILYTIAVVASGAGAYFLLGDIVPGIFIFILFYFLLLTGYSLMYGVIIRSLLRRTTTSTYTEHIKWLLLNFLSLFVVGSIWVGVMMAGYLFFIIPGLMLIVYLSVTMKFVLDEKARGLDALVLSTKYVYGRFWPILFRLIITSLVLMLLVLVLVIVGTMTVFLMPVAALVAIFVSYYGMSCAGVVLYESLLQAGPAKPLPVSDSTLRTIYLVAGVVGIFLYLGFTGWSMVDTFSDLSSNLLP